MVRCFQPTHVKGRETDSPWAGFTLSIICGVEVAGYCLSGGRPERATRTPVNIGN